MYSREIKDLSIAAEALSRIPGYDAEKHRGRVMDLIDDLLKQEETKPEPITPRNNPTTTDDEIPF